MFCFSFCFASFGGPGCGFGGFHVGSTSSGKPLLRLPRRKPPKPPRGPPKPTKKRITKQKLNKDSVYQFLWVKDWFLFFLSHTDSRGDAKRCFSFCFVSFFILFCRFLLVLVVVLVAFFLVVAVVALPLLLLPTGKPPKPPPGPTKTYKTKRKTKRNKTKNTV